MNRKGILLIFILGIMILNAVIGLLFSSLAKLTVGMSKVNILRTKTLLTVICELKFFKANLINQFLKNI